VSEPLTSTRERIVEALIALLEGIRREGGYTTDAGNAVYVYETPALGPDDPEEAIALMVLEDSVIYQIDRMGIQMPIEIQALGRANAAHGTAYAAIAAERVLADIKRAVETSDRTLGGLVKPYVQRGSARVMERQDGSLAVGVAIRYDVAFQESWGAP
jgi:hypothetical protein